MLRTLAIGVGEVVHGMLPGADGAKPGPGDPALAPDRRLAAAKAELRRRLVAGRRAMTEADRAAAGRRLRDAVLGLPEIADGRHDRRVLLTWQRARYPRAAVRAVEARQLRAAAGAAARRRPGLGVLRGARLADGRAPRVCWSRGPPSRAAGPARSPAPTWSSCPRWRPTGAGTGWARAAARMTGRWPGSAGWCPPWPCCLTGSCLTRSRLARMTCGYGSPRSRRKESSDWPRGCYHLAVRRGEC